MQKVGLIALTCHDSWGLLLDHPHFPMPRTVRAHGQHLCLCKGVNKPLPFLSLLPSVVDILLLYPRHFQSPAFQWLVHRFRGLLCPVTCHQGMLRLDLIAVILGHSEGLSQLPLEEALWVHLSLCLTLLPKEDISKDQSPATLSMELSSSVYFQWTQSK
jgi:hypothetical protein